MTVIQRSALLPCTAPQVCAWVDDFEACPQLMDGCVGAEVLLREEGVVEARLDLAKRGITQSFATCNTLQPTTNIELELPEGPFESFAGRWTMRPVR